MFAAALLFSCAGIELSIYSTCKRISQKLLRNVVKFLDIVYNEIGCKRMKVIRANCEEIHIQGPEGIGDVRVTNSYPSKVASHPLPVAGPTCCSVPKSQRRLLPVVSTGTDALQAQVTSPDPLLPVPAQTSAAALAMSIFSLLRIFWFIFVSLCILERMMICAHCIRCECREARFSLETIHTVTTLAIEV